MGKTALYKALNGSADAASGYVWRTQWSLSCSDPFWALLASGQITMRKVDGWQTLATKPSDQPIDLAA